MSTIDLIPSSHKKRDAFRDLVERGVPAVSVVVDKREEEIDSCGERHFHRFVTLEHTSGGQAFRGELRFHGGNILHKRSAWEQLTPGQRVAIKALPEAPSAFYAPEFLEAQSEAIAAPEVEYVMYIFCAAMLAIMIGALLYLTVLRRGPKLPGKGDSPTEPPRRV